MVQRRHGRPGGFAVSLRLVTQAEPRKRKATPAPVVANRWRGAGGAIVGGFVPLASWITVHAALDIDAMLAGKGWTILTCILVAAVIGALVFSAGTVYEYCLRAFRGKRAKSAAFVVLVEVLMTFVPLWPLSVAALVILAAINGIQTARTMALTS